MDDRGNRSNSPEKSSSRKRSYAELCARRPGRSYHLPLHLDSESSFAQAPSESLNRNFPPPARLRRYEGDGLDLRRPIMSIQNLRPSSHFPQPQSQRTGTANDIIDLTDESDMPLATTRTSENMYDASFGFTSSGEARSLLPARTPEVINLEDIEDDNDDDVILQEVVHRAPEVEFVSAQPRRDRPHETTVTTSTWQSHANPHPWLSFASLVPQTHLNGLHQFTQALLTGNTGSRNDAANMYNFLEETGIPDPPQTDWFRAGAMDFTRVAFDLGGQREPTRPATATMYEAPSAPPDGFTRTIHENDVIVCANCDRELGTGDDMIQRQIWVVRKCGHAYCGTCAPQKNKKRLLSKCVVHGCNSQVRMGKAYMFVLYI